MGNKTTHGKPQRNGIGLKSERHGEGADREGGTCFMNTTERKAQERLAFSGSKTKELKETKFKYLKGRDSS